MNAPAAVPRRAAPTPAETRPLRVLQVVDGLGMGGAEAWLIELLRYWRAEGGAVRADILATGGAPGVFDDEARGLGARIRYLRFGRHDLATFAAGFRRVLGDGYDAVHDHQDFASGWHFLLGRGLLPPVRVSHVHNPAYQIRNNYGVTLGRRLTARAGRRLVARYATHIAGTSREALTDHGFDAPLFDRVPKAALYCGFDPSRFRTDPVPRAEVRAEFGWPADATIALFAGRFDISPDVGHPQNHKNSGLAVDIAIAAARADDRVRFLFAGVLSPAAALLKTRIEAAGVTGRIAFAGVRRDIGRLMRASDALLFPSRAEGLGMVAVEAQAAALPVLASDTTPRECLVMPELVSFLSLDAGVEAWRDRLLALLAAPRHDPDLANRRLAASPFAIAHSAAKLERLYRDGVLA